MINNKLKIKPLMPYLFFSLPAFLSFLCIFESFLTELTPSGDVIALRVLLYLNQIYGVTFLLITPLIAVETLSRLLWSHSHKTASQTRTDPDGCRCHYLWGVTADEEEDGSYKGDETRLSYVVSYFCCLFVWVFVALDYRCRWRMEEVWASACLHTTNSLIECLPRKFINISTVSTFSIMTFFLLLLLFSIVNKCLQRLQQAPAPLTFTTGDHVDSQCRSRCVWQQWGFPCLGVNVMIGFMGVLSIFVLPLILSVNILLIRTVETLLEQCIKSLVVSSAANTRDTSPSHDETLA